MISTFAFMLISANLSFYSMMYAQEGRLREVSIIAGFVALASFLMGLATRSLREGIIALLVAYFAGFMLASAIVRNIAIETLGSIVGESMSWRAIRESFLFIVAILPVHIAINILGNIVGEKLEA